MWRSKDKEQHIHESECRGHQVALQSGEYRMTAQLASQPFHAAPKGVTVRSRPELGNDALSVGSSRACVVGWWVLSATNTRSIRPLSANECLIGIQSST
jgi:hypothetical protein